MYKLSLALLLFISQSNLFSQSDITTYTFKKGEILDLLLASQNPNKEAEVKEYLNLAVSVAQKMSYQSLPGYNIQRISAGNIRPSFLLFGKWDNQEIRTSFSHKIEEVLPDFHERRRNIFSFFGLTYYEIKKNLSFDIDKSRYNVATAFWNRPGSSTSELSEWHNALTQSGGTVILELKGGTSPFGYLYRPDVFYITSWDSEEEFNTFKKLTADSLKKNIIHLNQFILS